MPLAQLPEVQRLEGLAMRLQTPCGPDGTMAWRRWGEGPPLVLLHGGSGSWTHWLRNIDTLAQRYTVFAADLPGCGDSALPPGARDADTIHQQVANGIAQLAGGVPVQLVAFSFGTVVAGFIAATRPELVKHLHLAGCAGLGLARPRLELRSLAGVPAQEQEAVVRANMEALMVLHPQTLDDTALSLHYANLQRDRLRRRRISRTPVMIELQARWQCPVHAVWGSGDVLIRDDRARLPAVFSGCELRGLALVEDAGHWLQYERPQAFDAVLLQGLAAAD
ncbi:alpha/beta fold hydrolase [Caenimonas terrae]|uniref:Alpha/beta fold hydrolase n=1 Tax=Caenimonas terrae TaxID=696074 RepID=A0ABW0NF48_9BURK